MFLRAAACVATKQERAKNTVTVQTIQTMTRLLRKWKLMQQFIETDMKIQ